MAELARINAEREAANLSSISSVGYQQVKEHLRDEFSVMHNESMQRIVKLEEA